MCLFPALVSAAEARGGNWFLREPFRLPEFHRPRLTDPLSVSDECLLPTKFLRFRGSVCFCRSMRGSRTTDLPDLLYDTHFSGTFRTSQSAISAIFGCGVRLHVS